MFFDKQSKEIVRSTKRDVYDIKMELSDLRAMMSSIRDSIAALGNNTKKEHKNSQQYDELYKKCCDYKLLSHKRRGAPIGINKMKSMIESYEKSLHERNKNQ